MLGSTIQAARLQRTFFLAEVVKRNVFERDVVEIEIAAKVELRFNEPREPAAENAAAGKAARAASAARATT